MRRLLVAHCLLLVLLASSWPLLHSGFFRVHDYTHGARIAELSRAVGDGHVPPHWSKNFGYGYGMPLFLFYAPLPYYFGALVFWFSGSVIASVSAIFLLANVATILGAYFLGKRLFGSLGGVLLAAAITLAPYRAVNLFIRGAVSETWGMAAGIWMLLGLVLVVKKQRAGWLVLCLSTTALLLSHNLITLIFLPFFGMFALGLIVYQKAWKQVLPVISSCLLGIGISAYYILPAFIEKSATQVEERILTQYFDFHLHFLYLRQFVTSYWGYGGSVWGPHDDISFFFGYGMLLGLAIASFVVFRQYRQKKPVTTWLVVIFGLSLGLSVMAILMSTEKTLLLWERVSLLRFVQFPWRFLSVAIVFFSLALTSGIMCLPSRRSRLVTAGILFAILLSNWRYFRPESYLVSPETLYSAEERQVAQTMSGILPDYLPQGFDETALPVNLASVVREPKLSPDSVLVNHVQEKLVSVTFATARELVFALADFPGWRVEIDGKPVSHTTTIEGLITATIPAGSHLVGVRFLPTPVRVVANSISALCLLMLFAFILNQERKR